MVLSSSSFPFLLDRVGSGVSCPWRRKKNGTSHSFFIFSDMAEILEIVEERAFQCFKNYFINNIYRIVL